MASAPCGIDAIALLRSGLPALIDRVQRTPHRVRIRVKSPGADPGRLVQVEDEPRQRPFQAEWNQCHALPGMATIAPQRLQLTLRLVELVLRLLGLANGLGSRQKLAASRSLSKSGEPGQFASRHLFRQPVFAQRCDENPKIRKSLHNPAVSPERQPQRPRRLLVVLLHGDPSFAWGYTSVD